MRKHLAIHDRENIDDGHKVAEGHEITNASESSTYSVPYFVPITNHPCRHCQVTFSTKRDLLTHLAGHAEINPFHCLVPGCDARFPSQKKLAVHERKLYGKQHSCTYCRRVCVSASQLENISLFIQARNLTSVKNVEKLLHKSLMSHIISTQSMVMVGSKRRNIYAKSVEKYL